MNSKIIIAALLVVGTVPLATAPFVTANHFSIGNQDSVGISPTEGPGDPSVPTTSDLWIRGTGQADCSVFDPSGDLDAAADEAAASATADAFCDRLIYNTDEGQEDFEQTSPPDQDYPVTEDLLFDMVWTSYVGNYGLSTCLPAFCTTLPGGPLVFNTLHDAGALTGLTENGEDASENEEADRFQQYAINLQFPNAGLAAQEALGGNDDSNGWLLPNGDQSLQAFLQTEDESIDTSGDGNVDDAELKAYVDSLKEGTDPALSEENNAQVCAFKPGNSISINAPQPTFCEVLFKWYDEEEDVGEDTTFDEYSDPCDSPTYVCGANQPGWYALLVMLTSNEMNRNDVDYEVWHGVVAPAPMECSNAEPGFEFDPAVGAPYLAHDLDIYEPITRQAGFDSGETVLDWQGEFQDTVESTPDETVEEIGDMLPDDLAGPVTESSYIVSKDRTVEPNTAEGDTSQSLAGAQADSDLDELTRDLETDACDVFRSGLEEAEDPWVDYIDGIVWQDFVGAGLAPLEKDPSANQHQDASNSEATALHYTAGQIGMFTDKNDDGEYDQAGSGDKFTAIDEVGAYPLFWDMFLEEDDNGDLVPATDQGCSTGFGETKLTEQMVQAGYEKHTGLLQVVYLTEPSFLFHDGLGFASNPTMDATAYVFLSQGLQELREAGDVTTEQAITNALAQLPGDAGANADRVFASDLVDSQSDYTNQCQQSTGGFSNAWSFSHTCETGCAGDTIVTSYVFELADGTIGGGELPDFDPDADDDPFNFDANPVNPLINGEVHQWFDVDPFDGDETRNNADSSAPPTPPEE